MAWWRKLFGRKRSRKPEAVKPALGVESLETRCLLSANFTGINWPAALAPYDSGGPAMYSQASPGLWSQLTQHPWYGNYLGPGNNGWGSTPINALDQGARTHDLGYSLAGADGIWGALTNTQVSGDDWRLATDAWQAASSLSGWDKALAYGTAGLFGTLAFGKESVNTVSGWFGSSPTSPATYTLPADYTVPGLGAYGPSAGIDPYTGQGAADSFAAWNDTSMNPYASFSYDGSASPGAYQSSFSDYQGGYAVNPSMTYTTPGWDVWGGQSVDPSTTYTPPGWDIWGGQSVDPSTTAWNGGDFYGPTTGYGGGYGDSYSYDNSMANPYTPGYVGGFGGYDTSGYGSDGWTSDVSGYGGATDPSFFNSLNWGQYSTSTDPVPNYQLNGYDNPSDWSNSWGPLYQDSTGYDSGYDSSFGTGSYGDYSGYGTDYSSLMDSYQNAVDAYSQWSD